MSSSTPLQSFLGGLGLAVPVYSLLFLNGNVFGISGFLNQAVRGGKEAIAAVAGLVSGGMLVGVIEGGGINAFTAVSLPQVLLSGLFVGLGSKVIALRLDLLSICGSIADIYGIVIQGLYFRVLRQSWLLVIDSDFSLDT